MDVAPVDTRDELRRRLRGVLHTIDESLSLNRRGMHVRPLFRVASESPQRKDSSHFVPCVSAWANLRTEQRRKELHTQREEAEQLLQTLKRAQERRRLQQDIAMEADTSSSVALLTVRSRLDGTEVQQDGDATALFPMERRLSPSTLPPPTLSSVFDAKTTHEQKSSNELLTADEDISQVAAVEEAARRRLAERRAAEEESLAKLRNLRRDVMRQRQEALAHAEAQIKQSESERVAKAMQLEQYTRRCVVEEQQHSTITYAELRAMEVHANALATLRSHTGIAVAPSVFPVRPAPPPPPSFFSQTDAVSLPFHDSSPSPDTVQNHKHHYLPDAPAVTATGPIAGDSLSPERECKVMTTIHSTPQRDITTGSREKLAGIVESSSRKPRNSGNARDGEITTDRLSVSPRRSLEEEEEEEVLLESPLPLSLSSPLKMSSSTMLFSEKEHTSHQSLSPALRPRVCQLISPTLTSHDTATTNTSEILVSRSGAFKRIQGCGIVAYVLTSEVNVFPVLLRLSADSQELLLHVGRLKSDIISSQPSTKCLVKGSEQVACSPPLQKEENRDYKGEVGCGVRRVEEVHHLTLLHGILLCPFGSISADSSGKVGGVWCGSIARRLLRRLSCTLFAHLGGSSYRVFLVSFTTPQHTRGDSTRSPQVINPNTSTLLVLQFRNRQDWAAFLMTAGGVTGSSNSNGSVSLTYGRALWILAACLWQRRRSCAHFLLKPTRKESVEAKSNTSRMTCAKHFRMVPKSLLSFSCNPGTGHAYSQHINMGDSRESGGLGMSKRRFVIPTQRGNSNTRRRNSADSASKNVVVPHLDRGRRFGLRASTNSVSTSPPSINTPDTLMGYSG